MNFSRERSVAVATRPAIEAASSTRLFRFFRAIVVIQGIHVVEHVIQLLQVGVWGVPDDDALGLLGYVFQFNGTEEWLHLVFNVAFLISLFVVFFQLDRIVVPGALPHWAKTAFLLGGVGLETWHVSEHVVIIANVIRNSGCPCPGIGDRALGVSDTQLHFVYNAVAYAATVLAFTYVLRARRRTTG